MKILHLLSQHPEATGSGIYLKNVVQQASRLGHQNFVVAGASPETKRPDWLDENSCLLIRFGSKQADLPFIIPGMSDVMPYPSSRFSELTKEQLTSYCQVFTDKITNVVTRIRPDMIHSHHLWIMSCLVRRLFPQIPIVSSCHATDLRQYHNCPHLRPLVDCCGEFERIFALSKAQVNQIQEVHGVNAAKIDLVGGGFDASLFTRRRKTPTGPVKAVYAGKLSQAKGVDLLLTCLQEYPELDLHLDLVGAGTGEEAEQCLLLAAKLAGKVTIHGRLDQGDLAELLADAHLLILPSFYEGLPLVLLEGLAAGCRLVTTDLNGCREVLGTAPDDLVAWIELPSLASIDRPSSEDIPSIITKMAAAISEMIERVQKQPEPNPDLVDSVLSKASWEAVYARIETAYAAALKAHSSARKSNDIEAMSSCSLKRG